MVRGSIEIYSLSTVRKSASFGGQPLAKSFNRRSGGQEKY
jgi:hypothetical protein